MIPAELADDIWDVIKQQISDEIAKELAEDIVRLFEAYDCDDLEDTEVYQAAHPDE